MKQERLNRTAKQFEERLQTLGSPAVAKSHGHLASDSDDVILGVRMGQVFAVAKEFMNMELNEVEMMLESPIHEMRVGAVSIMDFQARSKKTPDTRRKELLTFTSAAMTASIHGTWLTARLPGWWVVT